MYSSINTPAEDRLHGNSLLLITLDSCRYDAFLQAHLPNMKGVGSVCKAYAHATFTYASHQSIFMGFLPSCRERIEFFNSKFRKLIRVGQTGNPVEPLFRVEGRNMIDGLKKLGYRAIGSGAVSWFDTNTETGRFLTQDFDEFYYPGRQVLLKQQLEFLQTRISYNSGKKLFCFLNIGVTHTPYYFEGADCDPRYNPCVPFDPKKTNDAAECKRRQIMCLEYIDSSIQPLLTQFSNIIITGDHGDCWGEDGLWEHGIYHEKVMEVPLIIKLRSDPQPVG